MIFFFFCVPALKNLSFSFGSRGFKWIMLMIKGSCNLNKVRFAITRLFRPWLNAAPPHYEKQAPLVRRDRKQSQHTVSIVLFIKEIHLCLWEDTQASLRRTNSTICTLAEDELRVYYQAVIEQQLYFIFSIVTKIWVLEWRCRALYTHSHHSWADHMGMWQSLRPAEKLNSEDGRAHVQPFSFEPKCKSAAELQECVSL